MLHIDIENDIENYKTSWFLIGQHWISLVDIAATTVNYGGPRGQSHRTINRLINALQINTTQPNTQTCYNGPKTLSANTETIQTNTPQKC